MISKFALLLTTLFLGVGMNATAAPATIENVLVQAVESLDTVSVANYDNSCLGTIFYQSVDESKIINKGKKISTAFKICCSVVLLPAY